MPLRLRRNSMQRVEFWKNAYVPDLTFESGGKGRMRKRTADGTGIGSLSAVCRISMQMRVHEVRNAVLMLANSLEHRSIIGGE